MMSDSAYISVDGKSSVDIILNPCGEHKFDANAKFPDGTLSQSGVQRFREFDTLNAPWTSVSSVGDTTLNWSLWIISPPAYKTLAILLASRNNNQPTSTELALIFNDFNSVTPPKWPAWRNPPADTSLNFYYSVYEFSSANLDLDPLLGSRKIESYRLVGDGFVVMHNTPTLWDQGSFAVGQYQSDVSSLPADQSLDIAEVVVSVSNTLSSAVCSITYGGSKNNGVIMPAVTIPGPLPGSVGFGISESFVLTIPDGGVFARYAGVSLTCNITFVAAAAPLGAYYNFAIPGFATVRVPVSLANTVVRVPLELSGPFVSGIVNNPNVKAWTLPPLSQKEVVQADPKFSAELMKKHMGFYAVRRYFEPKLRMSDTSDSGLIKCLVPGINKIDVVKPEGGLGSDCFDVNGSVIVAVIRGISFAASPTIKSCRFVEFMPSPGSDLAPFVGPTPEKDEDAEEMFRQFQLSGPHSYIPDANSLGFLSTMLWTAIEHLPIVMRGARSISHAIARAVDWAEENLFSKVVV